MDVQSLVERLRRPEHTGARRCWPCTVVNVVLLGVATLLLRRRDRGLALPTVVLGAAAIWLRGYLVPGTPTWAPRLVAALPLPFDPFDHGPAYAPDPAATGGSGMAVNGSAATSTNAEVRTSPDTSDSLGADLTGEELLDRLLEAGLVTDDGEDLVLNAQFEADWHDEMAKLRGLDTDELAEVTFEVAHAADYETYEDEYGVWVLLDDGRGGVKGRTWLTRPVAIAETAAVRALKGRVADRETRLAAAGPLRMFLGSCPDCETELRFTTSQDCCGGGTDPRSEPDDVLACPECSVRLYTFPR